MVDFVLSDEREGGRDTRPVPCIAERLSSFFSTRASNAAKVSGVATSDMGAEPNIKVGAVLVGDER